MALAACMLTLALTATMAEPVWSSADSFAYRRLSQADGLSDSTVFTLTQDAAGMIWLGTASGGVNVFDGYGFRSFSSSGEANSLSHNDAGVVLADSRGRIWIGTWGAGLNRFAPESGGFERINPDQPPTFIQAVYEDSRGRLWIGSAASGIQRYDPTAGTFRGLPEAVAPGHNRIWDIAETPDGRIWAATSAGLLVIAEDGLETVPVDPHPRSLLADGDDLWLGTAEYLKHYSAADGRIEIAVADLPRINTLHAFGAGKILIGTFAGLYMYDPVFESLVPPFGATEPVVLPDRNIRDIHQDRTGLLWLATREAGVVVGQAGRNGFAGLALQGTPDAATSVRALGAQRILIGSRNGLWTMDTGTGATGLEQVSGSAGLSVAQLLEDGRGGIWVGTVDALYHYDPVDASISMITDPPALDGLNVTELRSDPSGGLWIGAWTDGVVHYEPETGSISHFSLDPAQGSPGRPEVSAVAPAGDIVWVGTWSDGLYRIDRAGGTRTSWRHDPADATTLPHGHIFDLYPDPDGPLWVATSFGLARLDPATGAITRIPVQTDNRPTPVLAIVDDLDGYLWLSTKRGIVRLNRRDLSTAFFSEGDGLVLTEFYVQSSHRSNDGSILFGGVGGLVRFDPRDVQVSIRPPQVSITGVFIDDRQVFAGAGALTVPAAARALRVEFSAMDFKSPENNQFQFFLDGYDPDWGPVTRRREISYANLPPGRYTLRVRAANGNGIWNLDGTSLALRVVPYWWESWPGRAAILTGLLLVAWLMHWRRTARIRATNRELTRRVEEQTRELRSANEALHRVAVTDHLTGLANRRGFSRLLQQAVSSAGRKRQLCVALGDIDDFKQVNDRYGHETGDEVLKQVAAVARAALRENDTVARWGGEEFIFLFPDTPLDAAVQVAERVRTAIAAMRTDAGAPPREVTITLGVAAYQAGETVSNWISRADQAAYAGKLAGKNRVECAD